MPSAHPIALGDVRLDLLRGLAFAQPLLDEREDSWELTVLGEQVRSHQFLGGDAVDPCHFFLPNRYFRASQVDIVKRL